MGPHENLIQRHSEVQPFMMKLAIMYPSQLDFSRKMMNCSSTLQTLRHTTVHLHRHQAGK
jgi:hypothetical protein